MTEEIIIDGVNVAECECYSKETGLCNYELSCNLKSNCVFKVNALKEQLKCLEQKYNEVLKLAKENADSNEYCLQELEKENENLKSLLDFEVQKAETYQQENEELKEKNIELQIILNEMGRPNNYRHALEEIKEIVHNSPIVKTVGNAPMVYYSDYANKRNEIITKIDEVLK